MLRRLTAFAFIAWIGGFIWFSISLPPPRAGGVTDAVIVPTGGPGRIARGLEVLDEQLAGAMLVTGVDREVKPGEFAAEFDVPMEQMQCCVTLGFQALDTRGNASEAASWIAQNEYKTVRMVTTDWHMNRAAGELERTVPDDVVIVRDAVSSEPSLFSLFLEYHKMIASWLSGQMFG